MSSRKRTPAEARERRAKIAAVVLGVVFVAVLAIQVPRVLKQTHGSSTSASSPLPVTPDQALAANAVSALAAAVSARTTHLERLDRFAWKDPFRQQARPETTKQAAPTESAPPKKAKPKRAVERPKAVQGSAPPPQQQTFSSAPVRSKPLPAGKAPAVGKPGVLLLLNGKRLGLLRGDLFPTAEPVFRLVSFSKAKARVALVAGTLSDGGSTLVLRSGHELDLTDASTGERFKLELVCLTRVVPQTPAS